MHSLHKTEQCSSKAQVHEKALLHNNTALEIGCTMHRTRAEKHGAENKKKSQSTPHENSNDK